MSIFIWIALGLGAMLFVYLLAFLFNPEKYL